MISREQFAEALKQELAENFNSLPGIITKYDATENRATILPLVKISFADLSTQNMPEIAGVPVVMPKTAFSGINLPVSQGDKVWIVFQDRSIERLLETVTAGTDNMDPVDSEDPRLNDYNDAVAFVGLSSFTSAIPTDSSLEVFHNKGKETECKIRLEENGDILVQGPVASMLLKVNGDIELTNAQSNMELLVDGTVNITAPSQMNVNTPILQCTGDVVAGTVSLQTHVHPGVMSGPSVTGPPTP